MAETPPCAMHPVPGRGHSLDVNRHDRTGERACTWCGKRESDWPAAPSVGEPEPSPHCVCGHRLDRHLHTLPAGTLPCLSMLCWCSSFRAADPVQDRPPTLDDFARLLALGATSKGTYLTPDQSLALRSSLEEARKDSERLDWLASRLFLDGTRNLETGELCEAWLDFSYTPIPASASTVLEAIDAARPFSERAMTETRKPDQPTTCAGNGAHTFAPIFPLDHGAIVRCLCGKEAMKWDGIALQLINPPIDEER